MFILVGAVAMFYLAVAGLYVLLQTIAVVIMAIWGTGSDA